MHTAIRKKWLRSILSVVCLAILVTGAVGVLTVADAPTALAQEAELLPEEFEQDVDDEAAN